MIGIRIPWQVWACTGVLLLLYGSFWWGGHRVRVEWKASIERGKTIVEELQKKQLVVTTKVETKYVDRVKVIKEKGDTIIQKVPVYIPASTPDLPGGFRLLHDGAVLGATSESTSPTDAAPVPVRDAASTIAKNYETCHITAARLEGLQEWIREQQALYLEQCKQPGVRCSKGS